MAPSATGASEGQDLFITIPLEPIEPLPLTPGAR